MKNHIYLVCYDIEKDYTRTKLADVLQRYGYERIQYSIFVGIENPRSLPALWNRIQVLIPLDKVGKDRIFVIRMRKQYLKKMLVIGNLILI